MFKMWQFYNGFGNKFGGAGMGDQYLQIEAANILPWGNSAYTLLAISMVKNDPDLTGRLWEIFYDQKRTPLANLLPLVSNGTLPHSLYNLRAAIHTSEDISTLCKTLMQHPSAIDNTLFNLINLYIDGLIGMETPAELNKLLEQYAGLHYTQHEHASEKHTGFHLPLDKDGKFRHDADISKTSSQLRKFLDNDTWMAAWIAEDIYRQTLADGKPLSLFAEIATDGYLKTGNYSAAREMAIASNHPKKNALNTLYSLVETHKLPAAPMTPQRERHSPSGMSPLEHYNPN